MTSAASPFDAIRPIRGQGVTRRAVSTSAMRDGRALSRVGSVTSFDVATTVDEFLALGEAWQRLEERVGADTGLFQRFSWLSLWCKHFVDEKSGDLCVVTVRRDGELVCALPLVVQNVLGLRQLTVMGGPVSQYSDALVVEGPDRIGYLRQAWTIAMEHARPSLVRIVKVREDAALAQFLSARGAIETSHEFAPFVRLDAFESETAYWKRFSAKKLKNLRRLKRRLEERGPYSFDWALEGRAAEHAVGLMMVLKRAWLRERGCFSKAFGDPRFERFFAEAAQQSATTGVEMSTLTTAGETANSML